MSQHLTVDFEEVPLFKLPGILASFRVPVTFTSIENWTFSEIEVSGVRGWEPIRQGHAAWKTLEDYVTSDAGYERIEDKIRGHMEENQEPCWFDAARDAREAA